MEALSPFVMWRTRKQGGAKNLIKSHVRIQRPQIAGAHYQNHKFARQLGVHAKDWRLQLATTERIDERTQNAFVTLITSDFDSVHREWWVDHADPFSTPVGVVPLCRLDAATIASSALPCRGVRFEAKIETSANDLVEVSRAARVLRTLVFERRSSWPLAYWSTS